MKNQISVSYKILRLKDEKLKRKNKALKQTRGREQTHLSK